MEHKLLVTPGLRDRPLARVAKIPRDAEVWMACASGHRASIAASLPDHAGIPVRAVATGAVFESLARCYLQVQGRHPHMSFERRA